MKNKNPEKKYMLGVELDSETRKKLDEKSKSLGLSKSDVARIALKKIFEQSEVVLNV